jgi:hypothetical protein
MITENIRNLLLRFLSEDVIVASWGISDINISDSSLSFHVDGFKFQGDVKIEGLDICDEYKVCFYQEYIGHYKLDDIVSILDERIERSESCYQDFVKHLFG